MLSAPITLTDDQVREVETLAALLSQEQIADYFGIARRTFQNILERDEAARARYKRGKAKAIAHVANGLLQKARSGHTTSMIFYLKTQAGWRETERIEHAVAARSVDEMTDAELEAAIRDCTTVIEHIQRLDERTALPGIGAGGAETA
jgi:Asp-tRNA(Asn)/Glu-tRNA(Gln) amidotransferase C subunit